MARANLALATAELSPCEAGLTFDAALAIIAAEAQPIGVEHLPIAQAGRRVLAEPVIARIDAPRADVAAMDGYAVRGDDLEDGKILFEIVARSYAGDAAGPPLERGCAIYVATGAVLPVGTAEILPWEIVTATGDQIVLRGPRGRRHIRERGSDFRRGDILLPAGCTIDPRALVVAAAADTARLAVWRRPAVALIATGNELVASGLARTTAAQVPDSLSDALQLFIRQWGGRPTSRILLADDPSAIAHAASDALTGSNVLVMVGGASLGERDFARAALDRLGLECRFAKVAIKPGKPVWYGRVGDRHVLGLPGNPTAALTTARLFLAPLLAGLGGRGVAAGLQWSHVPLSHPAPANGDREAFLCAVLCDGGIRILDRQSASSQATLAQADLLVRRPAAAPALVIGDLVPVVRF
jgi:molybdopterin molybdotransferase